MRKTTIAVLFLVVGPSLAAQSAYLVKDINSTTTASPSSSSPEQFFRHGARIYFAASTSATGKELWATDGTEAGTVMVADLFKGTLSSSPSYFTDVNGNLIFNGRDSRGEELWTTDGTSAGTRVMADINSGSPSSAPGGRIVHGGRMIFAADDGVNGRELWITDGTSAGTRFFKDLAPGPTSSNPRSFVLLDGTIYFGTDGGLWKSDGTEAGTVLVAAVHAHNLVVAGSRVFFQGYTAELGSEPWVSDGTAAGTHIIRDVSPGAGHSVHSASTIPFGDRVLLALHENDHGTELWISDGTEAGTQLLRDIFPGTESGVPTGSTVAVLGDRAIFAARSPEHGTELWQTDGTPAGTSLLLELTPGADGLVGNLITVGTKVYFVTSDPVSAQIWVTDGTAVGTRRVTSAEMQLAIGSRFTNVDGTLYFSAANRLNGYEPWKSDGTASGTAMVANVSPDSAPSSDPGNFHVAADWLYFRATDGIPDENGLTSASFWRTDGTPEGTLALGVPAPDGDSIHAPVGRLLFYQTSDWRNPFWVTDGTPEGTKPATEFASRFPERPAIRFVLGDRILVGSNAELWATTAAHGAPAVRLNSKEPFSIVELGGRALYLAGDAGEYEIALWSTDGTPAGTYVVRSFGEHGGGLVAMGGHAYFSMRSDDGKTTLWKTDGTPEGTVPVTAIPGMYGAVVAGEKLFFTTSEGGALWVTDGTAAGTRALPANPNGGRLVAVGTSVVFVASDAVAGTEPWTSDGTPEGTRLLLDVYPGTSGSSANYLTGAGGFVYFYAYAQLTGGELWMTDGTPAGTKLAADVEPGLLSSYPSGLRQAGERLFFSARTAVLGHELWALPLPPGPRVVVEDVRVTEGDSGAVTARFTVALTASPTQTVTVDYATTDGTAVAASDYDAASGTLTFAAGETSKTFDVRVHGDGTMEGNETFLVTLGNPSGATIETAVAAGIIDDDDRSADVGLVFDFTEASAVLLDVKNLGPGTATNIRASMTAVPAHYAPGGCWRCPFTQLAPQERVRAFSYGEFGHQQYLTATVSAREEDPNASNNRVGWTTNSALAMDSLHLTPGSDATVWLRLLQSPATFRVESSDPSVVTVPATVTGSPNFAVHGVRAGQATIRVFTDQQTLGTIVVDVLAAGMTQRFAGALRLFPTSFHVGLDEVTALHAFGFGSAPFTGARPTGTLTVSANDRELARLYLPGDSSMTEAYVRFHLPDVGKHTVTGHYSGDDNFLPVTSTFEIEATRGMTTIHATAMRNGTDVIVRAHVRGSPLVAPTGRIGGGTSDATLTTIGPGLAEAEMTVHDVPAEVKTLGILYFGDSRYYPRNYDVPIRDDRRRSARH